MVDFNKEKIRKDIRNSTYSYFKNTDLYFRDYIYGDEHYVTLEDVILRCIATHDLDWESGLSEHIDFDMLVNDLYFHYIKADKKFSKNYAGGDERHRKNYIMKALRNATGPLLKKQIEDYNILVQELDELNKTNNLHYISIYSQDGRLLEDISYRQWRDEITENMDTAIKREQLAKIFKVLNQPERKVIYLRMKNKSYSEISKILQIEQDKVRKIYYFAKQKLIEEYDRKKQSA